MLVPFMLPEISISLSIAGPVLQHCAVEVRQDADIKGAVTFWREISGRVITVLWPSTLLAGTVTLLVVGPQTMKREMRAAAREQVKL